MFDFLIRGEINDDAVRVMTLMQLAMTKYGTAARDELTAQIRSDFESTHCDADSYRVTFCYKELEEFLFSFDIADPSDRERTLSACGRGKYTGINIYAGSKNDWFCTVEGGIGFHPTRGAKVLAKALAKKYGIPDMTQAFEAT